MASLIFNRTGAELFALNLRERMDEIAADGAPMTAAELRRKVLAAADKAYVETVSDGMRIDSDPHARTVTISIQAFEPDDR